MQRAQVERQEEKLSSVCVVSPTIAPFAAQRGVEGGALARQAASKLATSWRLNNDWMVQEAAAVVATAVA